MRRAPIRRRWTMHESLRGALVGAVERGFPAGPWVLVLGMHRSGTSALTGALGRLGLALPDADDLVSGRYDNPVHYESQALMDLDDAILRALGGSWSAPPVLDPGWERSAAVLGVLGDGPRAARRAFPHGGPMVWKDPRHCLLLPLWQSVLPPPVIVVFLWRAPAAVARSLGTRQGFSPSLGLALWERYNRQALAELAGRAVYVMRYEELLADPRGSLSGVAHWLDADQRVPMHVDDDALGHAASTVVGRPEPHDNEDVLPDLIHETVAVLANLSGAHDRLPTTPTRPAPLWMADVIAQRRDYEDLYAHYMRYVKWRRRIPFVGRRARPAHS